MNWATLTALVGMFGGLIIGYLGYQRSKKVDAWSERLGVTTETREGTEQIIQGLTKLVDQLQESDGDKKETIRYLDTRLAACFAGYEEEKKENARLRRKYGNGD